MRESIYKANNTLFKQPGKLSVKSSRPYNFRRFFGVITIVLSPFTTESPAFFFSGFFLPNALVITFFKLMGVAFPKDFMDLLDRTEACLDD